MQASTAQRNAPTLPPEVQRVLGLFRARLESRFGERLVDLRLFGSRARGIVHEESDVDILVLVRDLRFPEDRAVTDLAFDVEMATGFELAISPLVMTPERYRELLDRERLIALEIEQDGIRV